MTGGLPTYFEGEVPAHLMTRQQLLGVGRRPTDPACPVGAVYLDLFDSRSAVPLDSGSASPGRAEVDRWDAHEWAKAALVDPDVVFLGVESTAAFAGRVIEVAAVGSAGEVLLETLVNPDGEPIVPYQSALHGVTDEMVAESHVPRFFELAHDLDTVLAGKRIITWNAGYVRGLLSAEAERLAPSFYGETEPTWKAAVWEDAVIRHAAWVGKWDQQRNRYRRHPLEGGHRSLGHCNLVLWHVQEIATEPKPPRGATHGSSAPGSRVGASWTDQADQEMTTLFRSGITAEDIAVRIHRTEKAVRLRLYKLGLAGFPADEVTPRRPAEPEQPLAYTVDELRKEHRNSHQRWTPEEDARLVRRAREGATVEELMAAHGRNQGAIIARLGRVRLTEPDV